MGAAVDLSSLAAAAPFSTGSHIPPPLSPPRMAKKDSKVSEKLSKGVEMRSEAHAIEAAGRGVRELAGEGSVKTRIERAHGYLRGVCKRRRVKAHLYGEVRQQPAHEAEAIKAAVQRKRREEITRLRAQIATLEVQQKADLDAMAAQLPTLLGPLYPMAVKAGLINPEAVEATQDGEA